MLQVTDLRASYSNTPVLRGVSFTVAPGEIVALLGRNGCGRSTTAKALMGLTPAQGSVQWMGQELLGVPPHQVARSGLGYVPENRDVFPTLTVHQNLMLGLPVWRKPKQSVALSIDEAYDLFPLLKARKTTSAGVLSGGEQQLLSLCRTLLGNPRLLVIDEPTEGLAPNMVASVGDYLVGLRARGVGVLLIEQKLSIALRIADRLLVMGKGELVFEGTAEGLRAAPLVRQAWLEV